MMVLWQLLAAPATPFVFILILVSVFTWGLVHTRRNVKSVIRSFKNAEDIISPSTTREEFYTNFDTNTDELKAVPYIGPIWSEYEETFIVPTLTDDETNAHRKQIILSARPEHYFSIDSSLGASCNLGQLCAVPNYLIGLGLLFTFLGLAAAIGIAQHNLMPVDGAAANPTDGLQQLLAVASTKFLTSVFAIFFSLALSFCQRTWLNELRSGIRHFNDKLEIRTEFMPSERILHKALEVQESSKFYLIHLADNITTKFEQVISQALPKSVAEAMAPLVDTLKQIAGRDQSNNESALKAVLQEFLTEMRHNTGEGMNQLVQNIETLAKNLNHLVGKMESFGGSFGNEMGAATQKMATSMERFVSDFSGIQQGMLQFNEVLESLKTIAESIQHAGTQMHGAATGNKESSEGLTKTHSELAATVSGLSGNIEPLKDLIGELSGALGQLVATSKGLGDAGNLIKTAADGFAHSSNRLDQAHDKIGGHLDGFKAVADGMHGNLQELVSASGTLAKAASPVEILARQMTDAVGSVTKAQEVISSAFANMTGAAETLQKVSSGIERSWTGYELRFQNVDKDMEAAFTTLTKGTDDFQLKVRDFVGDFDSAFSKAIQSLSGAVQELAEEREEQISARRQTANG